MKLNRLLLLAALLAAVSARADVRLPNLFTDHMVLQQGLKAPVWGWADDGEKVTVEFKGQKISTVAKGGRWQVALAKLKADAKPATLKVSGKNSVEVKDVVVGEVWVASGQSNMEFALKSSHNSTNDIAAAANPLLRLFHVPKLKANAPTNNIPTTWAVASPETVPGITAVGYYFARDLQKALGVPVGLIQSDWGGSPAEVWMSEAALTTNPEYKRDIFDAYGDALKKYRGQKAAYDQELAALKAAKNLDELKKIKPPREPWKPTELYNGMIAPLIPYAIKGAIWYQGESNANRAEQYRRLFADMIRNWRGDWGQGDFTFLAVQLAPHHKIEAEPKDCSWAELREAQQLIGKVLKNAGTVVINDVGDEADIHPKKKRPVGERLAIAARGIAYGQKITYSGPAYRSVKFSGADATISFDHVGKGLEARGGELTGFAICGADKKWVWARAEIRGGKIVVSNAQVTKPVAVRYGWADFPVVNLWNKDGLMASPFRTDDFPLTTAKLPPATKPAVKK
ncbi:MAG: sialate O-acetylesterase [Verrucomicrobia bacterium]|nr:sialate O-acetylesterase [Verrucomicrobiota bacterium]